MNVVDTGDAEADRLWALVIEADEAGDLALREERAADFVRHALPVDTSSSPWQRPTGATRSASWWFND